MYESQVGHLLELTGNVLSLQCPERSPRLRQGSEGHLEASVPPTVILYQCTCGYHHTNRNQLVGVRGKDTHETSALVWALPLGNTLSLESHQVR